MNHFSLESGDSSRNSNVDRHNERGVALVIVLAIIVLLTGLMVAYFSRSITSRQLSNSSAGQTKSAILALSASDFVIAGLKQEIINGSTTKTVTTGTIQSSIYVPTASTNMVPVRYPVLRPPNGLTDPIPNFVRRSAANDLNIPAPGVPSLASKINTATDVAVNGRSVSPARWNSHYLIPRADGTTDTDSTPDNSGGATDVGFVAPDWVLMTRAGPEAVTGVNPGGTAINNPIPSNQHYVIGRYAYAVYDEGGLLDLNAAGYPTPTSPAASTGFTTSQVGRKNALPLADLTQLPVVRTPGAPGVTPANFLSQRAVDSLVGWRNFAAAGPSGPTGTFPLFTFGANAAGNWYKNFASANSAGFLKVYGTATGSTDQAFLSRQQLLRLRTSIYSALSQQGLSGGNFTAHALQYLGTFSRSLEQPSYIHAHILYPTTAPNINAVATTPPPVATAADNYLGNNDVAGSIGSTSGQDLANPSFLSIRAASGFTRLDGSTAVIGEPLVKRRFSLRRLSWITYKGPSADNLSDTNVQLTIKGMGGDPTNPSDPIYQLVAQGTAANIQKYFGLTWNNGMWTYAHNTSSSDPIILTLPRVAALTGAAAREPDFAELLKASINVGSLAKGGPNLNYFSGPVLNYQYTLDTSIDYNILQIFANLVDQFDADSYPTVIMIPPSSSGVTYPRYVRGVEDLPYFYRYHPFTVVTDTPSPLLSKANSVTFTVGTTPTTFTHCAPATANPLTNPGSFVLLLAPEVWNPHDVNSLNGTSGSRPPLFRITALTQDPAGQTLPWSSSVKPAISGSTSTLPPPTTIPAPSYTTLAENSSAFTFSDNNGLTCREPTMLWRGASGVFGSGSPVNSNLQPGSAGSVGGPYKEKATGNVYYGILVAQSPLAFTSSIPSSTATVANPDPNNNYIFEYYGQANEIHKVPAATYEQHTFRLEYQNPISGDWIVYDEKYPDLHGLSWPNIVLNPADYTNSDGSTNNQWQNPWRSAQMNDAASSMDPRVARFGIGTGSSLTDNNTNPLLEPAASAAYTTNNAAGNAAMGTSLYTVVNTVRPRADWGNPTNYSSPAQTSDPGHAPTMRWYSGLGFNAAALYPYPTGTYSTTWPIYHGGLLSQNSPGNHIYARNKSTTTQIYYEDADGMARRAMGAYATPLSPSTIVNNALPDEVGLPETTANSISNGGVATAIQQSQSRPYILNRPFKNVAEMSYASRGGVWKQIDFFTPESGDTGLLDTFCVDDPLSDAIVAGKVNLNTHQQPVLRSILAGSYRDEVKSNTTVPAYAFDQVTAQESDNITAKLMGITMDTTNSWRGPLTNVSDLVGHLVPDQAAALNAPDTYTYQAAQTAASNGSLTGQSPPTAQYTYTGLSTLLDSTVYTYSNSTGNASLQTANARVQRFREAAIRPLAAVGQTRVWNLLIDVVAQTGRYPATINAAAANSLAQFLIEGEKRYWVHVAIDRYTGQVIDRQTEEVNE